MRVFRDTIGEYTDRDDDVTTNDSGYTHYLWKLAAKSELEKRGVSPSFVFDDDLNADDDIGTYEAFEANEDPAKWVDEYLKSPPLGLPL